MTTLRTRIANVERAVRKRRRHEPDLSIEDLGRELDGVPVEHLRLLRDALHKRAVAVGREDDPTFEIDLSELDLPEEVIASLEAASERWTQRGEKHAQREVV